MLKSLLEPVQADEDDDGVDKDWVGDVRYQKENDLLVEVKIVDIDCVESRLCRRTCSEEKTIDVT